MAGLVPAIHVLLFLPPKKDVDARNKCGHDGTVTPATTGFKINALAQSVDSNSEPAQQHGAA
jgi:hypothetical protein